MNWVAVANRPPRLPPCFKCSYVSRLVLVGSLR